MKKILLIISLFFSGIFWVSAAQEIFINPDISFLNQPNLASWVTQDRYISSNAASREQFCRQAWGTYFSHTTVSATFATVATYNQNNDEWRTQDFAINRIWDITCDFPDSNWWWGTPSSNTDITTRDYLEIVVFKEWNYYINQDTFSYLIVLILLAILLMKTLIKLFVWPFLFFLWNQRLWKK